MTNGECAGVEKSWEAPPDSPFHSPHRLLQSYATPKNISWLCQLYIWTLLRTCLSTLSLFGPDLWTDRLHIRFSFFFHRVHRIVTELHRPCALGRIPSRLSPGDTTSIRIIPLGASSHHGGTTQRHLTSLSGFWRILPLSPGERRQLVRSSHERAPG